MSEAATKVSSDIVGIVTDTVTQMLRDHGFADAEMKSHDRAVFAPLIDAAVAPLVEALEEIEVLAACPVCYADRGSPHAANCKVAPGLKELDPWRK